MNKGYSTLYMPVNTDVSEMFAEYGGYRYIVFDKNGIAKFITVSSEMADELVGDGYIMNKQEYFELISDTDDKTDGETYEEVYGEYDNVSHPEHYCYSKYQPKDVIREWDLNFNLGNAVKYIARAGRKDDIVQDLEKAKQYLEFEIEYLTSLHE